MVVHQEYLSRETALLQVPAADPETVRRAALTVAVIGARIEPGDPAATLEVLDALGLPGGRRPAAVAGRGADGAQSLRPRSVPGRLAPQAAAGA